MDVDLLAAAARNGDREALGRLFDLYSSAMWSHLHWRSGGRDRHLTDELASDLWEQVTRKIGSYDPERAAFVTWLRWLARSVLFTALRRDNARAMVLGQVPAHLLLDSEVPQEDSDRGPEASLLRSERRVALAAAVHSLPARQRRVVMADYEGLSTRETADALGMTEAAVKQARYRAMRTLRTLAGETLGVPSRSTLPSVTIVADKRVAS